MKQNKKKLVIGVVVVIISLLVNGLIYTILQVKSPLFLEHYYELGVVDSLHFSLEYITNQTDTREVIAITFPEIEQEDFFAVQDLDTVFDNSHYKINRLWVDNENPKETPIKNNQVITKAKIYFNNGDTQEVEIGKIVFFDYLYENTMLEHHSVGSSNNNKSFYVGEAKEDMKIEKIAATLDDSLENIIQMDMNKKKIEDIQFPIAVKKGDTVEINTELILNKSQETNYYDIQKRIYIKDKYGKTHISRVLNIYSDPIFDNKNIYAYLWEKGAIGW